MTDTGTHGVRKPKRRRWPWWLLGVAVVTAVIIRLGYGPSLWALAKPTSPEHFWGMMGVLLNVALLVAAVRGLKSLALTRKAMVTQATKDARLNAVQRCEEFADEVIEQNQPVLTSLATGKVPVFVQDAAEVKFDPDNAADLDKVAKWTKTLPPGTFGLCLALLNRLEAWAMYFTNQLADPTVAYGPCARPFCSMVIQCYAILLHQRNVDGASGNYPNLVQLYKAWIAELDDEQKGLIEGDLLEQLTKLQSRGSPSSKLPNPLGVDLDV